MNHSVSETQIASVDNKKKGQSRCMLDVTSSRFK
jgi:hypothetical protein